MDKKVNRQIPRVINVDGDMSSAKLEELIAWGCEEDELDYKEHCDLSKSSKAHQLELVRDIVAMANTDGGYVVVGMKEDKAGPVRFVPVGLSHPSSKSYDASTVRTLLKKFVSEQVNCRLTTLTSSRYPGLSFGLIFVEKSDRTPVTFTRDGQFSDPNNPKESITLFREGDILVRRNTSSIRADQSDIRRLISDIRNREKQKWTEDVFHVAPLVEKMNQTMSDVARLATVLQELVGVEDSVLESNDASQEGQKTILKDLQKVLLRPKIMQPDETVMLLGVEQFALRFNEVIATQSDTLIRQWLLEFGEAFKRSLVESIGKDASELLAIRDNRLVPILNALLTACWLLLRLSRIDLFKEGIDVFHDIFLSAETIRMGQSNDREVHFSTSLVWKLVIERVYVLGGFAVLNKKFDCIPTLIKRQAGGVPPNDKYWARKTLTALARENRLKARSLVRHALDTLDGIPYIFQQIGSKDRAIDAICQFDFLQCILAYSERGKYGDCYPSFAAYFNSHTEPIVSDLVSDGESRKAVQEITDEKLAKAIVALDHYGSQEFFEYAAWDENFWMDGKINEYVVKSLSPQVS